MTASLSLKALHKLRHIKRALTSRMIARANRRQLETYLAGDRRPWSPGYNQHKFQTLEAVLNDAELLAGFRAGRPLPAGYGYRLDARVIEIPWVLARLAESQGQILDAGASLNHGVVVKAPPLQGKQLTIFTLAPEKNCFWQMGISYVFGDLRSTVFKDALFDAVACISTIEHVGMDNTRYAGAKDVAQPGAADEFAQAVREFRRILKPAGRLFITFPFGRYENHGWFQQFDSALADRLIESFNPARQHEAIYRYNPDGWAISSRAECADCEFFDVHTSKYFDPGSTLEYPADYPAGERAVACLELEK